jgi:hypothetical protein
MLTPVPAWRDAIRTKESTVIDFCELTVPYLVLPPDTAGASYRIERVFEGPDLVLCNGQPIARSYSLGAVRQRSGCTVIARRRRGRPVTLLLAATCNAAGVDGEQWRSFCSALATLLHHQARWGVQCETECDQLPLERIELSTHELLLRLQVLRLQPWLSMAFSGECRDQSRRAIRVGQVRQACLLPLARVA